MGPAALTVLVAACAPGDLTRPADDAPQAALVVRANVAATSTALVVLEVTGPGIAAALLFNIPVNEGMAVGTVLLPAGSDRVFLARAYDAGGVETHRGSTVIQVHAAANPTVQLTLAPLTGEVPIDLLLGTVTLTLEPVAETLLVAGTAGVTARVHDEAGVPVSGPVGWATIKPSVVGVTATSDSTALVTGVGGGETEIVATFAGEGVRASIVVLHAGHYVAPGGTGAGDGTPGAPWDLQTALSGAGGQVQPGDTVWVRGGTYASAYLSTLGGTAAAPVVVRVYPGERAVLDGNGSAAATLTVDGAWAVYWGLEVMNSMTERYSEDLGLRPVGVYLRHVSNVKLVNLIIHDTGHGVFTDAFTPNVELYGLIIFNGGHENAMRGDGHGVYFRHDGPGGKVVRDNIIFNQFGFGLHGYTETAGALRNLLVSGNILFNNGELSTFDSFNLLVGGPRAADNDVIADNLTYFSPGFGGLNVRFGFPFASVINGQAVVRDNYFVGGKEILEMGFWEDMNVHDNTFIGSGDMIRLHDPNTSGQTWSGNLHFRDPTLTEWRYLIPEYTFPAWQAATGLAATDQAFAGTPGATRVFVRPNVYEAGRATVAVYNWSGAGTVPIDLTGVVTPGHVYEIRNVQRVFDPPVATGTYGGGAVPLSLTGVTAYAPIGGSPNPPLVTGPDFDVFLVTSHEP